MDRRDNKGNILRVEENSMERIRYYNRNEWGI